MALAVSRHDAAAVASEVPGFDRKKAPILAFACDDVTMDTLCRVIPGGSKGSDILDGGLGSAVALARDGVCPTLLIVDVADSMAPAEDMAELSRVCGDGTSILAIGPDNDVGLYRSLVRSGAADYLVKPVSNQDLRRAILTLSNDSEEKPDSVGSMVVVIGARGGSGATSVAAGLASALAKETSKQVALVDLDIQFGDSALIFDVDPGTGLRNALEDPDRVDSLLIASALVNCGQNLYLLAAEEPLDSAFRVSPEAITHLVEELKRVVDIVVVDMPRHIAPQCAGLLGTSGAVTLVGDLSLSCLRDMLRMRKWLETVIEPSLLKIAVNRVGHTRSGEVSREQFEKGLGRAIDVSLSEDTKVAKAALDGRAFAQFQARGRTATALTKLARSIMPDTTKEEPGKLVDRLWFGRKKAQKTGAAK